LVGTNGNVLFGLGNASTKDKSSIYLQIIIQNNSRESQPFRIDRLLLTAKHNYKYTQ
jgi:hypothetical protein